MVFNRGCLSCRKRTAKECDKLGLSVILGVEIRFPESERDYLLYGVDEMFLYRHPFLYDTTPQAFYGTFCDEVLIIQAHPFRNYEFIHEGCIHGLEIVNGNPRHANRNDRALQYALDNPDLFRLCGSDTHRIGDEGQNALLSCAPIHDSLCCATPFCAEITLWSKNEKDIILPVAKYRKMLKSILSMLPMGTPFCWSIPMRRKRAIF